MFGIAPESKADPIAEPAQLRNHRDWESASTRVCVLLLGHAGVTSSPSRHVVSVMAWLSVIDG